MSEVIDWSKAVVRRVSTLNDPALPGFLDIYQKSFPVEEQVLVSFILNVIQRSTDKNIPRIVIDVLAEEGIVAGFAMYKVGAGVEGVGKGGYLWYLAASPDMRGSGIGKRLYHYVRETLFSTYGCDAMFFEIELPEDAGIRHGPEAEAYANWRNAWYKHQGAQELLGTSYMCGVGWHPALPMQVMVHRKTDLTPEHALLLAREVQEEGIQVVGKLMFG